MKIKYLIILVFVINKLYSQMFINPDEITNGMKGYGLTVLKGWEPEKFEVEIIDVMKNVFPQCDIILAKVLSKNIEKTGIIAGMSGSPVYINDKLIGAIAYTWTFTKEPICGITPIQNMIEEKNNADSLLKNSINYNNENLKRIATPIIINGFVGEAEKYIKMKLEEKLNITEKNILFIPSGYINDNSIINNTNILNLKPGDAISINLIEGDYNIQGIGTVTYVSNDDVFIFGHPMNLAGNLEMPISKAYIYTTVPTYDLSFKIGAGAKEIGSTIYDGRTAVYCKLNKFSKMIPVSINVSTWENSSKFNFRVIDNKNFFSDLIISGITSSIFKLAGILDDKKITMNFIIEIENKGNNYTINKTFNYSYNPSYFNFYALISDLYRYFYVIYENQFAEIKINKILININIKKGLNYYIIENCSLNKLNFYNGENIYIKTFIKSYKGDYTKRIYKLKVSENLKAGQYKLIVANDILLNSELIKSFPKYYSINNIDYLITMASINEDINSLNFAIVDFNKGLIIKDNKLINFPEIYADYLDYTRNIPNPYYFPKIYLERYLFDEAIYGIYTININIQNKPLQNAE